MATPAKRLIVTGDDFGISSSVNAAIIRAHQEGILTSASLMVNGSAFHEAVELARAHPRLGVGLHLTLVRGPSTLSRGELSELVDEQGRFFSDPVKAGFRYFFDRKLRPSLSMEIEAQIRKFQSTRLPLSHLDGHLNFHVHPTILNIVAGLCRKHGIPAVRLPREGLFGSLRMNRRHFISKAFHALTYDRLCAFAESRLRKEEIRFPDFFFGLLDMGHMNEEHLMKVLDRLRPGVTELGMHPAPALPPEVGKWAPDYEYEAELNALLSPSVREKIQFLNIQLTTYNGLR